MVFILVQIVIVYVVASDLQVNINKSGMVDLIGHSILSSDGVLIYESEVVIANEIFLRLD